MKNWLVVVVVQTNTFLNSAPDGILWSISCPGESATAATGCNSWIGPRVRLKSVQNRKISSPSTQISCLFSLFMAPPYLHTINSLISLQSELTSSKW